MKKWLFLITTCISMLAITTISYAANIKIGVVNMNQILQKSPLMVSMSEALAKKFQPRQEEINNANKQLQNDVNQLSFHGSTMSDEDKNNLQNKIIQEKANIQILTITFQKDLAIARDQDLRTFMTKFKEVINKIAQDDRYDLIEQNSNILYLNNKIDLTQQVLQQIK